MMKKKLTESVNSVSEITQKIEKELYKYIENHGDLIINDEVGIPVFFEGTTNMIGKIKAVTISDEKYVEIKLDTEKSISYEELSISEKINLISELELIFNP